LLLPESSGALCMINNSRNLIEKTCSWGTAAIEDLHPPQACCGLRSGHPRWRVKNESEIHCGHFPGPAGPDCYLCVPIAAHGETQGVLYVECAGSAARRTVERRMDGLRQLLQLTGMTVASLNLRTKLENQSIRDPLTNLFNRHFMQIALERELARAERRRSMLAILMVDVDHFKSFNDTWGHAAGDTVLKDVAAVFRESVREEDIVCRYGGEEFMIIITDISPEDAWDRAESLRRAVSALRVPLDKDVVAEVTVSIGVALYPTDGEHAEILVQKADKALYRAKREGRNRVLLAELTHVA
jgi:diguanylate cyclase (GGDEF)-like protein